MTEASKDGQDQAQEEKRRQERIALLERRVASLDREIRNVEEIASLLEAGDDERPHLPGFDIYGKSEQLHGVVGGDHIIYLDFKQRYNLGARIARAREEGRQDIAANLERSSRKAGIVIADVAGHQTTDAFMTGMLHQAFLLGATYELRHHGEITRELIEEINDRFFESTSITKSITMLYGEISEEGTFRFLNAGHPAPVVFSRRYDRFMDIGAEHLKAYYPLGMMLSEDSLDKGKRKSVLGYKDEYEVNELQLMGQGDILLLYTDGLSEHTRYAKQQMDLMEKSGRLTPAQRSEANYFPGRLEQVLRRTKDLGARAIWDMIHEDMVMFGPIEDDLSYIVIKKI